MGGPTGHRHRHVQAICACVVVNFPSLGAAPSCHVRQARQRGWATDQPTAPSRCVLCAVYVCSQRGGRNGGHAAVLVAAVLGICAALRCAALASSSRRVNDGDTYGGQGERCVRLSVQEAWERACLSNYICLS